MKQVLKETQSVSDTFTLAGGISFILCDLHTGGTWNLQVKSPSGVWVGIELIKFTAADMFRLELPQGSLCRIASGTVGARMYVDGALSIG